MSKYGRMSLEPALVLMVTLVAIMAVSAVAVPAAHHLHHHSGSHHRMTGSGSSSSSSSSSSLSLSGVDHPLSKRSFFDIQCKGVYDKTIFARLDRVCEDCYNLFREPQLHSLCRFVSISSLRSRPLSRSPRVSFYNLSGFATMRIFFVFSFGIRRTNAQKRRFCRSWVFFNYSTRKN